ncbi:MAG TPA: tetratricopeptide repeat protein [Candidatus Angelobacter sp.]
MRKIQVEWIAVIAAMAVFGGNSGMAIQRAPSPPAVKQTHPEDAKTISDQEACESMKTLLLLVEKTLDGSKDKIVKITESRLTPTGYTLSLDKLSEVSFTYASIQNLQYSTGHLMGITKNWVSYEISGHTSVLIFNKSNDSSPFPLYLALKHLAEAAHNGLLCDCTGNVVDFHKAELDTFAQKAAAWRGLASKPPLSDEVTKKRLLAEDAVQQKDLAAAEDYYRAGVAIDPTWAAGWYNAALISAELKNYSAAAFDMKHYLMLLPDAPDAAAAKDKILLWEAKAEQNHR